MHEFARQLQGTCGEANISSPPDQPEECQPESSNPWDANDKLLVSEEVFGDSFVDTGLHKSIPRLCEYLHTHHPVLRP